MTRRDQTTDDRLEEAMDWFLRLNATARNDGDETAFDLWLNESPENRSAWAKACRTWKVMGEAALGEDVSGRAGRTTGRQFATATPPAGKAAGMRRIAIGAATLAACLIAFLAAPDVLTRYAADYTTATAQTRQITLEDGSTVELGASSAIAVDFSGGRRQVRLLSGQAFFDVRADAGKPFTVKTGALDVMVVGTTFDVNTLSNVETVQLAHGVVDLSTPDGHDVIRMNAGDTVTLDRASGRLSRATVEVDTIASWRDRKLFVQDVSVSTVISELQRYHPSWITVASLELGEKRVTGLYDLSDPDRALEALVRPFGGKVHRASPYMRVVTLF